MTKDSIAIAHKDYDVRGGGEVFCRRLAEAIDAPLYVGRRNHKNEPDDAHIDIREIPLSRLDRWMIDRYGITRTAAYALRWQAAGKQLADYDTVITSGNEPLWYVPPDDQAVIAYTHSTPRYMYDQYNDHMDFEGIRGRLAALFYTAMRTVYESNVRRPDLWVANSDIVARRIRRYWNVPEEQVRTVYPPVDTHNYHPDDAPTGEEYVYLGRLAPMKRVDGLVRAFNQLPDRELVIIGEGPERPKLERLAGDNVRFTGFVDDADKREWLSRARALCFPASNEDFGMVPIEALAAGTPVIAVNEGFQQWQLRDGVNGLLYERGESRLVDAIRRFEAEGVEMSERDISAWADQFGVDRFNRQMRAAIDAAKRLASVSSKVNWPDDSEQADDTLGVKVNV